MVDETSETRKASSCSSVKVVSNLESCCSLACVHEAVNVQPNPSIHGHPRQSGTTDLEVNLQNREIGQSQDGRMRVGPPTDRPSDGNGSIRFAITMTFFELSITVPRVAFLVALVAPDAAATERYGEMDSVLIARAIITSGTPDAAQTCAIFHDRRV